jgi:hypothetical protein
MDQVIFAALEVILVVTGRSAVWLVSFGRWRGESLTGDESKIFGAAGALWFVHEGRHVVTHIGQLFAGIAFYVLLVILGVACAAVV